jgi:hypothetical protein
LDSKVPLALLPKLRGARPSAARDRHRRPKERPLAGPTRRQPRTRTRGRDAPSAAPASALAKLLQRAIHPTQNRRRILLVVEVLVLGPGFGETGIQLAVR